ncbi:MAG TPA: thioesterase family protein [Arenicellales bacterium]|nr:thioesterase family protein [Arenicellales bacterium]
MTSELKSRTREHYPHFLAIPTRWMDNDIYGHVNNVVYYSYFDTVVNEYLIREGGLDIHDGEIIGIAVETRCNFFASLEFPETIDAGLAVTHLGNSSVRYDIGLFGERHDTVAAAGEFVHVFVDRAERRPVAIPGRIRAALERLGR